MKFLLLLLPLWLFAESYLISNIPLPVTYIQNLEIEDCDTACLQQQLQYGQIFSFLSYADHALEDQELNEARMIHMALFNLATPQQGGDFRIALLLPHRQIGRYAQSTTNAIFSYLLTQNSQYELKSFHIEDETSASIAKALTSIMDEGYAQVIAPLTMEGANNIIHQPNNLTIYIPTVNKNEMNTTRSNIIFGGIDYQRQIDTLLAYSHDPLVIFYDESPLGHKLKDQARDSYILQDGAMEERHIYSYGIDQKTSNLKYPLEANQHIEYASFFLNTPVVKSALVMTQLTLYDVNATNILSTQINYDPLLFTVTQFQDRRNMIIANSINLQNNVILEANALLNNDIQYDWINYATTIGIDYLYHSRSRSEREYPLAIIDSQVEYPITLVTPGYAKFSPITEATDEQQ